MKAFDDSHDKIPEFQVFRQCTRMVMGIMLFVSVVRTGDWLLHLTALKSFTKYFFAYDRPNYVRMIPLHPAEMEVLPKSDPEIYEDFLSGNWVVNKNLDTAFCTFGAALERLNRKMKVSGGIAGITLNPNARVKFFLIAPELSQLSAQAKSIMAGVSFSRERFHHYTLTSAVAQNVKKDLKEKEALFFFIVYFVTSLNLETHVWRRKFRIRSSYPADRMASILQMSNEGCLNLIVVLLCFALFPKR